MSTRVQKMERTVSRLEKQFEKTGRTSVRQSRLMAREHSRLGRVLERAGRASLWASKQMGRGFDLVDRALGRLWRRARMAFLVLKVFAGIMGGLAVRSAMQYERSLRSVMTLMDGAGEATERSRRRFIELDRDMRRISVSAKQTPQAMAEGLYEVVSTGFEAADATKILEAAAQGAYAGLTDVDTVTALLTQTLQAYRREGETAADLANKATTYVDQFFNAVNVGVFTFEDLAASFGDVASTAAAFNVPLEEALGFLSTATLRGVGLEEALTGLRAMILGIVSVTPQSRKALDELFGGKGTSEKFFGAEALATNGLLGVVSDLSAQIGDKLTPQMIAAATAMEDEGGDAAEYLGKQLGLTAEQFAMIFPNVRALKGILAVSGPGLETFADHVAHIGEEMGTTAAAAAEIDKSASGALQGLKAVWEQFKLDIGGMALPWIRDIADGLVEWWGELPERFMRERATPDVVAKLDVAPKEKAEEMVAQFWAESSPGERLAFVLRETWEEALSRLEGWFEGGGKERIDAIAQKVGTFFGQALSTLAGIENEDLEQNIFFRIGKSAAEGFIEGFKENFDLREALGNLTSGDSPIGNLLMWYAGGMALKGGLSLAGKGLGKLGGRILGGGARSIPGVAGPMAGTGAGAAGRGIGGLLGRAGGAIKSGAETLYLKWLMRGSGGAGGAAARGIGGWLGRGISGMGRGLGAAGRGIGTGMGWAARGLTAGGSLFAGGGTAATLGAVAAPVAAVAAGAFAVGEWNKHQEMVEEKTSSFAEQVADLMIDAERGVAGAQDKLDRLREMAEAPRKSFGDWAMGLIGQSEGQITQKILDQAEGIAAQKRLDPFFAGGPTASRDAFQPLERGGKSVLDGGARIERAAGRFESAAGRLLGAATSFGGGASRGGGGVKFMAEGGAGTVRRPTTFVAGEAGPEDFAFAPRKKGGLGAMGGSVVINMGGVTVAGDYDVDQMMAKINREIEKAFGNG